MSVAFLFVSTLTISAFELVFGSFTVNVSGSVIDFKFTVLLVVFLCHLSFFFSVFFWIN